MDLKSLGDKDVHIWTVHHDLDTIPENHMSILSHDELDKAKRFLFERDRLRYIHSHFALRSILSKYINIAPHELSFFQNEYGKPFLYKFELYFSLSHSDSISLIAISHIPQVGIDIEKIRHVADSFQIAKLFFNEAEYKTIENENDRFRLTTFFKIWTYKEAVSKAIGKGLSLDLRSFKITFKPEPQVEFLEKAQGTESSVWSLRGFSPAQGYMGALAIKEAHPKCYEYKCENFDSFIF